MELETSARRVLLITAGISVLLFVLHSAAVIAADLAGASPNRDVIGLVNVGRESSFPTWFSSALLASCAVFAAAAWLSVRRAGSRTQWYWLGLAVACLAMSIDEVAAVHERLTFGGAVVEAKGIFYFSWVIVGAIAAVVFALLYVPFLLRLPARTRNLFIMSGLLFVAGALVTEALNGLLFEEAIGSESERSLRYWLQTGVEELLEMLGTSLLLFTFADHLVGRDPLRLAITAAPGVATAPTVGAAPTAALAPGAIASDVASSVHVADEATIRADLLRET